MGDLGDGDVVAAREELVEGCIQQPVTRSIAHVDALEEVGDGFDAAEAVAGAEVASQACIAAPGVLERAGDRGEQSLQGSSRGLVEGREPCQGRELDPATRKQNRIGLRVGAECPTRAARARPRLRDVLIASSAARRAPRPGPSRRPVGGQIAVTAFAEEVAFDRHHQTRRVEAPVETSDDLAGGLQEQNLTGTGARALGERVCLR